MPKTLTAQYLRAQAATLLIASGSSHQEAETVANNLVMANLSGHDSHGVGMLPRYVDAVLEGGLIPNAPVATVLDIGTMLTLNGQRGYGQVVGEQAMQLGMARAKTHGSCIMALSNAHHLGRIGHFAEMAVAQGLVSIHFVNVLSRPVVAPWGGGDGRFGTNPFCVGIPMAGREHERSDGPPLASSAPKLDERGSAPPKAREATRVGAPFILDFATSIVAHGKVRVAYNQGQQVKPGLLIDDQGKPTTNPAVVVVPQPGGLMGALMTFGEHKGYGMAVACELLGGALTGGGTWRGPDSGKRAVVNGMLTILIDPARLGTQAAFEQESAAFIDWVKQSPAGASFDAVQMAGDAERLARREREQHGIEVDEQTWQEIVSAAQKVGVAL
jgi:hydroxycarboxylate dehydrogenase B